MADSFTYALYSLLIVAAGGVFAIALARVTRINPAYYFVAIGCLAGVVMPFTLPGQSLIAELSELGALFLIFLSAVEIEWDIGFKIRWKFFVRGAISETIVMLAGFALCRFVFSFDAISSLATGVLLAMHAPDRKVSLIGESFGGFRISSETAFTGFISEIVALMAISALIAYTHRTIVTGDLVQVAVGALLTLIILISFLPPALRFLMRRVGEESYALFYLMLLLVIAVILIVRRAGIEPLLGAYAAGFVLTRFISEDSKVLERLRFTGLSVIIPAFYIQLGIGGNLTHQLGIFAPLAATALFLLSSLLRYGDAWLSGQTTYSRFTDVALRLRKNPLVLTLVYVAYAKGVIPVTVLHTLLIYTALNEVLTRLMLGRRQTPPHSSAETGPRVLLPVSNPETMLPLLNLATHFGTVSQAAKIYPLNIVPDGHDAEARIRAVEAQFNDMIPPHALREQHIELTARIENDRIRAVSHAARELLSDRILLGLGAIPTLARPQGYSFLESLTTAAPQITVIAAHIEADLAATTSMSVIIASGDLVHRAETWLPLVLNLAARLKANPVFFGEADTLPELNERLAELNHRRTFQVRPGQIHAGLDLLTLDGNPNALVVGVMERPAFLPGEKIHARLPEMMLRAFSDRNFLLVYPPAENPDRPRKKPGTLWNRVKRFAGFS